ncbi:hypothetical protein [Glaciibacter sp. 2TAF33]|uniref:hypothetical protein n=1 Tax=Glaciibacter sp. 2TAF33 TaxID=3233015 RepID=UPI003F926031
MIFGDVNAHLGSAEMLVAWLACVIVFVAGLGLVGFLSMRMLGLARYGVTVFTGLVVIGCIITMIFGPFFLGADGPEYDLQAVDVSLRLHGERLHAELTGGKEGWPLLLGAAYSLVGRVPFVGILLNCIAVGVSAVFVASTAKLLWGKFSPTALYLWYFGTPLIALLGPSLMREALCWMAISMLAFGAVALARRRAHAVWPILVGAGALFAVRTSLAVLVITALAMSWMVCILLAKKRYFMVALTMAAGVAIASTVLGSVLDGLGFSEQFLQANRVYISADATTGFASSSLQPGLLGLLSTAAQVFPRVVLGPYPWEIQLAPAWIWVATNTIAWLVLLILAIRSLTFEGRRRVRMVALLAVALLLFGMSLSLTNYGIIVRMRGACVFLLLPLVLGGAQRGRRAIRSQFTATNTELIAKPQTAPATPATARPANGPTIMTAVSK